MIQCVMETARSDLFATEGWAYDMVLFKVDAKLIPGR